MGLVKPHWSLYREGKLSALDGVSMRCCSGRSWITGSGHGSERVMARERHGTGTGTGTGTSGAPFMNRMYLIFHGCCFVRLIGM